MALDEKTRLLNMFTRGTNRLFNKIERHMYVADLSDADKKDVNFFFELIKSSCDKDVQIISKKGEAEYVVKAIHGFKCSKRDHRLRTLVEWEGYSEKEWILVDTIGNLGALNDYFRNLPNSSPLKKALYT